MLNRSDARYGVEIQRLSRCVGILRCGGSSGDGGKPWDWNVDRLVADLAIRGICGGDPIAVKRTLGLKWYWELRRAWMRDPPADWFVASYFGYKTPEDAGATPGKSRTNMSAFDRARENTRKMGELVRAAGGTLDASLTGGINS